MRPTTLLAIDTSTRLVGIALYNGAQVVTESVWQSKDHHTTELAPAVAGALNKSGLGANHLNAVAVALGPGSFTGLRIGLAFAKGISMAQNIPIIGVPTLDILAFAQPVVDSQLAAVLRAGRGRLAVAWYQPVQGQWQTSKPSEVLTAEELLACIREPTQICGELSEEARDLLGKQSSNVSLVSPAHSLRRPSFLAETAWRRLLAGKTDSPSAIAPIYLHHKEPIPG